MTNLPEDANPETPTCVHRWLLSSPVGGTTAGLCRECGAERDFVETTKPYVLSSRRRK